LIERLRDDLDPPFWVDDQFEKQKTK